jgi:hypothetical protein
MTPTEQRRLNVEYFNRLLGAEVDLAKKALIRELLAEERLKPDHAYPDNALKGPRSSPQEPP